VLAVTGAVILLEELDYETMNHYELTVRANDVVTGSVADTVVHISVEVLILFMTVICNTANSFHFANAAVTIFSS